MLLPTDKLWLDYSKHILKWEGKTSADPNDPAAKCNPGKMHTNKGVTFCTFKTYAAALGVLPVTYDRFLNLSDADQAKFAYRFYKDVQGDKLPDKVALCMHNAKWGSGSRYQKELIQGLKNLGITAKDYADAINKVNQVDTNKLVDELVKIRENWFRYLASSNPGKFKRYLKGWLNRLNDFKNSFIYTVIQQVQQAAQTAAQTVTTAAQNVKKNSSLILILLVIAGGFIVYKQLKK